MGNLGDDALLRILLREGERCCAEFRPLIFSYRPDVILRDYHIPSVPAWAYDRRSPTRRLQDWALQRCQVFVLGGGSLLSDYGGDASRVIAWLSLLQRATELGRKTALCCIGVDTIRYRQSEDEIRRVLPRVDLIIVRDKRSAEYLRSIGIEREIVQVGDPTVLLAKPVVRRWPEHPHVAVCLRHWYSQGRFIQDERIFERVLADLAAFLDRLIERHNARVSFIPFRVAWRDDDRRIARCVYEQMARRDRATLVTRSPRVEGFLQNLPNYHLVVGMRLHSVILASATGIPAIGLDYSPKVGAFFRDLGLPELALPMEMGLAERLEEQSERLIANYAATSEHIVRVITAQQGATRAALERMFSLVD